MSSARDSLEPMDTNAQKAPPTTPGTKMRQLQSELENKKTENEELKKQLEKLTSKLGVMKLGANAPSEPNNKEEKKSKKIPVAPAKTAYKFYCEMVGPKGKNKVSEKPNMQQQWKDEKPEIRHHYQQLAQADKARFESEKEAYIKEQDALEKYYEAKKTDFALEFLSACQEASAEVENGKKKKKKQEKDEDAPKRCLSAYTHFTKDQHAKVKENNPDAKNSEIIKILAEQWKTLDHGEKAKYEELAEADRQRYTQEKAAYEEHKKADKEEKLEQDKKDALEWMASQSVATIHVGNNSLNVAGDSMSVISDLSGTNNNKEEKAPKKKKDPNAPKKNLSAYNYFVGEKRENVKAMLGPSSTNAEVFSEIGKQWKSLDDKDKETYVLKAAQDKERYDSEMKTYQASLSK